MTRSTPLPTERRGGPGRSGDGRHGQGRGSGRRFHSGPNRPGSDRSGSDGGERGGAPFKPSPYKVGDAVTVHNTQSGPEALLTVTGFSHGGRRMEVSDGGFWRADGKRLWRAGDGFYRGPWLEPTVPADVDRVRRRRLVGAIRKFAGGLDPDSPFDTARLGEIVDIIRAETARLAALAPEEAPDAAAGDEGRG